MCGEGRREPGCLSDALYCRYVFDVSLTLCFKYLAIPCRYHLSFCFIVFPSLKCFCCHCKYLSPSSSGTILSEYNHGNVILTSVFICVPANQLPLSPTPPPLRSLLRKLYSSERGAGLRAISHHLSDSSIWYTDSICGALQATVTDNTHTQMPLHIYVRAFCECAWRHVRMCAHPKLPLRAFLFSSGPIFSSISCRPCLSPCAPRN